MGGEAILWGLPETLGAAPLHRTFVFDPVGLPLAPFEQVLTLV